MEIIFFAYLNQIYFDYHNSNDKYKYIIFKIIHYIIINHLKSLKKYELITVSFNLNI